MFASGGGAPKKHSSELSSEALCAADTLEKLGAVESTSGIWRTRTVRLPLVNRTSVVTGELLGTVLFFPVARIEY